MKDIKMICADKLKALKANITTIDKKDAQVVLPISSPTLEKYLKGDIIKIDTATELIEFFTKKVNKRIKDLRATNVA